MNWETTRKVLDNLRAGVQARRKLRPQSNGAVNNDVPQAGNATPDFNDISSLRVGQNAL
jgi:hypothetical protein